MIRRLTRRDGTVETSWWISVQPEDEGIGYILAHALHLSDDADDVMSKETFSSTYKAWKRAHALIATKLAEGWNDERAAKKKTATKHDDDDDDDSEPSPKGRF